MTNETIINLALKDDNIEAALRITDCREELKKRICQKFLGCVLKGMTEIATSLGDDWEVKCDWPGPDGTDGNWTNNPSKKWLPILLRKKEWPHMVGISISADADGPKKVGIGVIAPTQQEWDKYKKLRNEYYGYGNRFIDIVGRQQITNAVNPARNDFWAYRKDININDWTNIDTLIQLHNNNEKEIEYICNSVQSLADKMKHLNIP